MGAALFLVVASLAGAGRESAAPVAQRPQFAVTRPISSTEQLRERLAGSIEKLERQGVLVCLRVVDPATGRELFERNSSRPVMPASNMKLTTTAAALDYFGPDKTFETKLLVDGEDLYLVGSGDPGPGDIDIAKRNGKAPTADLDRWADELLAKGKIRFAGSIHYVDNALELPPRQVHPTWGDSAVEWYGAPISGLNYNDNCIDITVSMPPPIASDSPTSLPTSRPGAPTHYTVYPETTSTGTFTNRSTVGDKTTIDIVRADDRNDYVMKGTLAKGIAQDSKPVTDPGAFFADAVRTHFAHRGITVAGPSTRASAAPATATEAVKPMVSVMRDLLWRTNKKSQNLFAEGLCKLTGRAFAVNAGGAGNADAVGTWENGDTAIRAFLRKNNIDDSAYKLADGSGLSRDNRVTTKLLSDLLVVMLKHPQFATFKESLPIGGVDGTIRSRFTKEKNRVFAKTGTIRGVRSLSGYVVTGEGGESKGSKLLVFSMIMNEIPPAVGNKPVEEVQDEIVRSLMEWSPR